jgi:hypothetical protein
MVNRNIYDDGSLTEKILDVAQEYLELQRLRDKVREAKARRRDRRRAGDLVSATEKISRDIVGGAATAVSPACSHWRASQSDAL